jgi:hypothetical protein
MDVESERGRERYLGLAKIAVNGSIFREKLPYLRPGQEPSVRRFAGLCVEGVDGLQEGEQGVLQ